MEWMLKVWDEIDDAAATIAHWWMGVRPAVSRPRRFTPTDVP
jgi:hypothetical protein